MFLLFTRASSNLYHKMTLKLDLFKFLKNFVIRETGTLKILKILCKSTQLVDYGFRFKLKPT